MNQEVENKKNKISLDEIVNQSFKYWKATLNFQLIVTLLYFGILMIAGVQLVQYYFGDQLNTFTPELLQHPTKFNDKIRTMLATENGSYFQLIVSLLKAAMFPLFIGFFKIYSLIDEGKNQNFLIFSMVITAVIFSNFGVMLFSGMWFSVLVLFSFCLVFFGFSLRFL